MGGKRWATWICSVRVGMWEREGNIRGERVRWGALIAMMGDEELIGIWNSAWTSAGLVQQASRMRIVNSIFVVQLNRKKILNKLVMLRQVETIGSWMKTFVCRLRCWVPKKNARFRFWLKLWGEVWTKPWIT